MNKQSWNIAMTDDDLDRLERKAEQHVRREARKHGFTLIKSRSRNPRDVTFGGYMLALDGVVVGGGEGPGYTLHLDDIADYLNAYAGGAA